MEPIRFLQHLAQALSTIGQYQAGDAARERIIDRTFAALQALLIVDRQAEFSFLGNEVSFGETKLAELREWDWSQRLAAVGVQRLEFDADVSREDFVEFLEEVATRIAAPPGIFDTAEGTQFSKRRTIRYRAIGSGGDSEEARQVFANEIAATSNYQLSEEAEAVKWIHDEVRAKRELPLLEAETVVRSLSVAMHGENEMVLPLLMLREFDQYTTTHSLNVSVLTMALGEHLGLNAHDVWTFGVAGLLHDIGTVKIPTEILNKPGKLTAEERAVMQAHTIEGARLILASDRELDIAAAVAYEHHILPNGGGYPKPHYERDVHKASTLVHVCDVYDALRTNRPYRSAWEADRVLAYIGEKAGSEFEPEIAGKFVAMMRGLRVSRVEYSESAAASN